MGRLTEMTKKLIEDSFLELLQTTPISKITVRTICEQAGLSRSTFYRYYIDVYDVFDSIEMQFLNKLKEHIKDRVFGKITTESTTNLVYFFISNRKIHLLLTHNSSTYIKHIHDMILKVYEDNYSKVGKKMSDGHRLLVEYNIGGTLSAIDYVLSNKDIYSPNDVLLQLVIPFTENLELYSNRLSKSFP